MIEPKSFFRAFLKTQMSGLTGHIEQAGYPFDSVEWGRENLASDKGNPYWWVYEQTAYWLDGFIRCAILLKDKKAIKRAETIVYNVLDQADDDGYLGPDFLKTPGTFNRWPHVVFFRACMALYSYNHDRLIVDKLTAHYLGLSAEHILKRNVLNVEIMLLLYAENGDRRLLDLAESSYKKYNELADDDLCDAVALSNKKPYAHGVSYNEYSKLGALLYIHTGKKEYLDASVSAYRKIDRYFMLIDGLHCSNEFLISDGVMQTHETCDITDYTYALNYMFEATLDSGYLDRIEKCIFNAGLGSVTDDFRALQYFSCPNQLVMDRTSNHSLFYRGSSWMSYRPNPGTECCPGNVNRFMPNYVMNSWAKREDGVYLKLYGAGVYSEDGVKISEETDFPYGTNVRFSVQSSKAFRLFLRVPSWADGYELVGIKEDRNNVHKGFIALNVTGSLCFELKFKISVRVHRKRNYAWVTKGCLLYAFAPDHDVIVDRDDKRSSKDFPAYNIYPKGEWAYGVDDGCKVTENEDGTLSLEVYKVSNWKLLKQKRVKRCVNLYAKQCDHVEGPFVFTPPLPALPLKESLEKRLITLIPYGKTTCRISAFPVFASKK